MSVYQVVSLTAAGLCFAIVIRAASSIVNDVNESIGTAYTRLFSLDGNTIWKEHQRVFPSSRKRTVLSMTLFLTFTLMFVTAYVP